MRNLIALLLSLLALQSLAQKEPPFPKFGKITTKELQTKIYSIDSQAKAVVLQDVGYVAIEGNSKGWFSLVTTRHRVVHILNNSGYDLAKVEIPLYRSTSGDEERISNIRATTYNLEGGKIVESKMDKSSIFSENESKFKVIKKFTMPNVKEGSIIEYEYKVTSDFMRSIDPWIFQEEVPVLWSEFTFGMPAFFTYAPQLRGYLPLAFTDRKDRSNYFSVRDVGGAGASQSYNFSANVTDVRWVMKDIPALVEESFTSSIKNHLSRLEFTLIGQNDPLRPRNFQRTWFDLTKSLMDAEEFGQPLKTKGWMPDEVKPMFASAGNEVEKAKKIFEYVRDNFTSLGNKGIAMSDNIKNILKAKKGGVADLNIVLASMLRYHGLDAWPLILSTTGNGYVWDTYPTLNSYNYVVVLLKINGNDYLLDASRPLLGFNYILPFCYNGTARIIGDDFGEYKLSANDLTEVSNTMVIIANDEKGNWVGRVKHTPGMSGSYNLRNSIKEKGEEAYFKELEKNYGVEVDISNPQIDSLKKLDIPVTLQYEINMGKKTEDLLYITPMFREGWKKNPFVSPKRSYPVEMPYTFDETYVMTMEIPVGYELDEMPKQMMLKLDESGASFFEYRISRSGNQISFRSRVKIAQAFFMSEDYELLREFFTIVVKKHNEQIVFKMKK